MSNSNWKTIEGVSGREPTAITLKSIREILAESDEPAELMGSKEAPTPETAKVETQAAPASEGTSPETELQGEETKESLTARLKSRFFGG